MHSWMRRQRKAIEKPGFRIFWQFQDYIYRYLDLVCTVFSAAVGVLTPVQRCLAVSVWLTLPWWVVLVCPRSGQSSCIYVSWAQKYLGENTMLPMDWRWLLVSFCFAIPLQFIRVDFYFLLQHYLRLRYIPVCDRIEKKQYKLHQRREKII